MRAVEFVRGDLSVEFTAPCKVDWTEALVCPRCVSLGQFVRRRREQLYAQCMECGLELNMADTCQLVATE